MNVNVMLHRLLQIGLYLLYISYKKEIITQIKSYLYITY